MLEFDVDMQLVADELDLVVLHDECGEMEPVEYVPRSEVEKLKALIRDMYTCINHVTGTDVHWSCADCPLDGTRECDFEGRLITMGIEVDDTPDEPMSDAARRVFNRLMSELGGDGR